MERVVDQTQCGGKKGVVVLYMKNNSLVVVRPINWYLVWRLR